MDRQTSCMQAKRTDPGIDSWIGTSLEDLSRNRPTEAEQCKEFVFLRYANRNRQQPAEESGHPKTVDLQDCSLHTETSSMWVCIIAPNALTDELTRGERHQSFPKGS